MFNDCPVRTFGGSGLLRQHIQGSEGDREAGGLHSWRRLGVPPQLAAELRDALHGGTAPVLHPDKGQQEGHQRTEDHAQQRAPSSEDTASADEAPLRHSSHDDPGLKPPSFGDSRPHLFPPLLEEPKSG